MNTRSTTNQQLKTSNKDEAGVKAQPSSSSVLTALNTTNQQQKTSNYLVGHKTNKGKRPFIHEILAGAV